MTTWIRILLWAGLAALVVAGVRWCTDSIEDRGYQRGRAEGQALRDQDATARAREDTQRALALVRQGDVFREEEGRREAAKQLEIDDAKKLAARWQEAATASDRAATGLLGQLAVFVADAKSRANVPADPDAAQRGAAAPSHIDLLAELYGSSDRRAGELSKALDVSRAAGLRCERLYDALIGTTP